MKVHFMERLWNYLKLTFIYMAKRGLVKRGKLLSKTLLNLILHLQNHHFKTKNSLYPNPLTLRDYEFSCSNSPNPMLVKVRSKIRSSLFSCFSTGGSCNADHEHCFSRNCMYDPAECLVTSPCVITVSDISDEEGEGDDLGLGFGNDVDYRAEKFIESFYEQLRAQNLGTNFILHGVDGDSF